MVFTIPKQLTVVLALLGSTLAVSAADAREQFHWVQYVPGGLEARAVTDAPDCPAATIDGAPAQMTTRSSPGDNYPVRVCALALPAAVKAATIDDEPLPLPKSQANRILVFGDSGCRLKGKVVQACNDPDVWPFRTVADVAAFIKPDLVIHVGDYHYRESACPRGDMRCGGTPFGDNWNVWRDDFFAPAELLLDGAPWIFVHGNHEECDRGGRGWARTLDPRPWSQQSGIDGCMGPAPPFEAKIGGPSVIVMDVSTADEEVANVKQAAAFRKQFQSVKDLAPQGPVWLAFHRPIWSTDGSKGGVAGGDNKTLALAAQGVIPDNVQIFLSGHQHKFEVDSYEQDLPVQIISGQGGDMLSPDAPTNPVGLEINGVRVKAGFAKPRTFGFSLLEHAPNDRSDIWTITDYDPLARPLGRCRIEGRSASCESAAR